MVQIISDIHNTFPGVGGGGGFPIHYKKFIFWAGWRGLGGSDTEQSKKAAGR